MEMVVAVALLVAPVALGFLAGSAIRRAGGRGPVLRALFWIAAVVAPLPAALLFGEVALSVGVWDVALRVLLFTAVAALALSAVDDRVAAGNLLLAIASVGITLLSVELLLRACTDLRPLPAPPVTGVGAVHPLGLEPICGAIYAAEEVISDRLGGQHQRTVILHLGDSMVYGTGAGGMEHAFPRRLGEMDGARTHVNAGFHASSTDGQWLLLRRWLPRLRPRMVVHYVFVGNDLHELDRASICCGMRTLVTDEGSPRCDSPDYEVPPGRRLVLSPAPFEARVVASRSLLAAQTVRGFAQLGFWLARTLEIDTEPPLPPFQQGKFERFARLEQAIRDTVASAGADLVVVLLVPRPTAAVAISGEPAAVDMWSGEGPAAVEIVRGILAHLGIDTIDTTDFMESLVGAADADDWFARDTPGDFHFSARGHEALAHWLWPQLGARLAADARVTP